MESKTIGKKRKQPVKDKKRKRSKNVIPYLHDQHGPVIEQCLNTCILVGPTGKKYYYCGLSQQEMVYGFFPVLINKPEGKADRGRANFIIGATSQALVFTVLKEAFKRVFPEKDPTAVLNWEIYLWNQQYYGCSVAKKAPFYSTLIAQQANSREFGGDKIQSPPSRISTILKQKSTKNYFILFESFMSENECYTVNDLTQWITNSEWHSVKTERFFSKKLTEADLEYSSSSEEENEESGSSE